MTVTSGSPTYFSQNGADIVLPDPRLIAGSWRRRWNSSLPDGDPLTIGDDAWRETHRALVLGPFDLRTEVRDSGHGRDRTAADQPAEVGGRGGLDPTRYGDWEVNGLASDF